MMTLLTNNYVSTPLSTIPKGGTNYIDIDQPSFPILDYQQMDVQLSRLKSSIRQFFDRAEFKMTNYVDPEEGWKKRVLNVVTGIDDFETRVEKEDAFYSMVDRDSLLRDVLKYTIVSFS